MSKIENPYSLLLTEEQRIILKTRKLREEMVDHFIDHHGGLPTKGSEMRVVNEVLNSLDDQVLELVEKRLKHEENQTVAGNTEAIVKLFKTLNKQKAIAKPIEDSEIPDKYIPDNIVPGEDSLEYEEIELSDIIREE